VALGWNDIVFIKLPVMLISVDLLVLWEERVFLLLVIRTMALPIVSMLIDQL
jgi:hypothetical protein